MLAAASTDEKLELAKRHGADAVFNYTNDTIKAKVMEFTGDRGIDVAYDPVGADYAEQVVRSMAWNGRYLVIGFAGGKIPAIPLNLPLLKGCSLVGVFWGAHTRREPQVHAANLKALFQLFEEGKIKPHVTELDGLDRFTEALDVLNGRRSTGQGRDPSRGGRRVESGLADRPDYSTISTRSQDVSSRYSASSCSRLCAVNVQVRLR